MGNEIGVTINRGGLDDDDADMKNEIGTVDKEAKPPAQESNVMPPEDNEDSVAVAAATTQPYVGKKAYGFSEDNMEYAQALL